MLVVTTNDIPGWEIRSRNAFAQIGAGFKSMFGGEPLLQSRGYTATEAQAIVLAEMTASESTIAVC